MKLINDPAKANAGDVVRMDDGQTGFCLRDGGNDIVWRLPMEDDDTWLHRVFIRQQMLADIVRGSCGL